MSPLSGGVLPGEGRPAPERSPGARAPARPSAGLCDCRESPWKPTGARRRARAGSAAPGRALCPRSDPGPAAAPVGSCSRQAATARRAEDAGRSQSRPLPSLLAGGGSARRSSPTRDWLRPRPAPTRVPASARHLRLQRQAREGGPERARVQPPPPRALAAPAPWREPGPNHRRTLAAAAFRTSGLWRGAVGFMVPSRGSPKRPVSWRERTKGRGQRCAQGTGCRGRGGRCGWDWGWPLGLSWGSGQVLSVRPAERREVPGR